MRSPLRRFGLRVRLVAAFGLGALALSVVLATVTYEVTKSYLLQRRERSAQQQAFDHADVINEALATRGTQIAGVFTDLRSASDTQSLLRYHGRWYTSTVGLGPDAVPKELVTKVGSGTAQHQRIRVSGTPSIVIGIPLKDHPAQYYEISQLQELDSTLRTLGSVLVIVAASVTVAAAALGFWTSRRLLQPLTTVTETSREIAGGRLDARIGETPDRQLAMLSASFNEMADALQARIQREIRFTADVSHELRSPLTAVSAALGVLEARRNELSDRGRSALDLLGAEVRRFSQLVEDLLEISKNDAGAPIDLEPVCLAQIVLRAQLLTTLRTPVRIEVESPALEALMMGDKRRLERVVANLLDNAARYTNGTVELQLSLEKSPTGHWLRLSVDDDGPGVPEADRERIFDRFARSKSGSRRSEGGGAGLGLALVRQHVELHGGEVHVERSRLGGACFVVRFPALSDSWQAASVDSYAEPYGVLDSPAASISADADAHGRQSRPQRELPGKPRQDLENR